MGSGMRVAGAIGWCLKPALMGGIDAEVDGGGGEPERTLAKLAGPNRCGSMGTAMLWSI